VECREVDYEGYVRVIFKLSYVATIQPEDKGAENVTPGCMELTYGDDEKYWSIFHLLVVWSVRTEYFSSLGCMEYTYGDDEKY
jgi:hypothetical protein